MAKVKHAYQIKKKPKAPSDLVIREILNIMNEMKQVLEQTKEPIDQFPFRDKINSWYSRLLLRDPIKCIKREIIQGNQDERISSKHTLK